MSNTDVTIISIHALREEGDFTGNEVVRDSRYFYPRPPRGGRPSPGTVCLYAVIFLSTPSARRATDHLAAASTGALISIHALREEGDLDIDTYEGLTWEISIHALREEGDLDIDTYEGLTWEISIHALREEGDLLTGVHTERHRKFLSTPSARRAT